MLPTDFALFPIDDDSRLFISPAITDWSIVRTAGIEVVLDMEGGLDLGVPTIPNEVLYVYFPFNDGGLPDLARLRAVGSLGASLVRAGEKVLSHCGLGFNRSALVAGLVLVELGMKGTEAVTRLRERRPGALFNEDFAAYLSGL
ncbi:MAG: dual specificity protein phosphatase family protein [Acidobacteria bacterium]|nr:dual specificity protein phosphatase family protein [Acidobacteriota bacterium]MCG3194390.1 hypothetical protein [Thermoanaerobaculia bacterium]